VIFEGLFFGTNEVITTAYIFLTKHDFQPLFSTYLWEKTCAELMVRERSSVRFRLLAHNKEWRHLSSVE